MYLVLEAQLEKLLKEIGKYEDFNLWKVARGVVEKKLQTVSTYFPHFSKHDKTHSEQIAIQIANLLGARRVEKLSASDIMMMLLAFYYHDIGMVLEYKEIREVCQEEIFQKFIYDHSNDDSDLGKSSRLIQQIDFDRNLANDVISLDIYRATLHVIEDMNRAGHAQRSSEYILRDTLLKSLLGLRLRRTLAQICNMHQKNVSSILELDSIVNGLYGDFLHPRLIAAMLLLGDLLDLDSNRFDEVALRTTTPLPELSLIHKEKHEAIQSYLVRDGEIKLTFDANDVVDENKEIIVHGIKIYREMQEWCNWIKETCTFFSLHWEEIVSIQEFGNAPKISECILKLRGENRHSELLDLSYILPGKRMFELLQGKNIYRNKFVCIREIIQNAVDATILRLFMEEPAIQNNADKFREVLSNGDIDLKQYSVHGTIKQIKNNGKTFIEVTIRDYGAGVSNLDVKKIARIDNKSSLTRERTIRCMPIWFRPSGSFGLGLQSIFLLTSQFEMITRTMDEPPKRIVFYAPEHGNNGYIDVSRYRENWKQGTQVRFCIERKKLQAKDINCPDYHFRTDRYIHYLLVGIQRYYGNLQIQRPVDAFKREEYDYVPVSLEITMDDSSSTRLLRQCLALPLENLEVPAEVLDGFAAIEMFVPEIGCYIWCHIRLEAEQHSDEKKSVDDHLYRNEQQIRYMKYGQSIFFRNVYVTRDISSHAFDLRRMIPLSIDWRINLLSDDANCVLDISRNNIQESYMTVFREKLKTAICLIMKKGIDYLLKEKTPEIKDTILLFYEAAVQNKYYAEELERLYQDVLKNICIGGYFFYDTLKEKIFKFQELKKKKIYFFINVISADLLSDTSRKQLESEAIDSSSLDLYDAKPKNFWGKHILDHCPRQYFIGRRDDEFLLIAEAVPFEKYRPNESALEIKSEFLFRYMILSLLKKRSIGFHAIHGYEKLAVPVDGDFANLVSENQDLQEYVVNLPVEQFSQELLADIEKNGYVDKAELRYFERIRKSSDFIHGIDYVCEHNSTPKTVVIQLYENLLRRILGFLSDPNYKIENKRILNQANTDRKLFCYNDLKYSPYMSV